MVKEYINGNEWTRKALEKMKAFLDRTPILITEIIGTKDCKDGVFIIPEGAINDSLEQVRLFFPFDYDMEPKTWVHNIREAIIPYYPRIVEPIYENVELTPKEMAIKAEEGLDISSIPKFEKRLIKRNCWRIDKILCFKDIFILTLEGTSDSKEGFTPCEPKMVRYKYQGSSVIYLNKLRNQEFKNYDEASKEFFNRAIFIDEVRVKNEA